MSSTTSSRGHRLIMLGLVLFLLGLLTGLVSPGFANPRMGLAAHVEGVMNGMFLVVLGLVWSHSAQRPRESRAGSSSTPPSPTGWRRP